MKDTILTAFTATTYHPKGVICQYVPHTWQLIYGELTKRWTVEVHRDCLTEVGKQRKMATVDKHGALQSRADQMMGRIKPQFSPRTSSFSLSVYLD